MLGLRAINPLRCARGAIPIASFVNIAAAALFNSSNSAQLLVVWNIDTRTSVAIPFEISVTNQRLTNRNVGTVSPVVVDEGAPPGEIDWDDLAAAPPPDYFFVPGASDGAVVPLSKPIAVLRPGWSLVVVEPTAAEFPAVSFYWEWCWPQDLYTPDPFARNNLP